MPNWMKDPPAWDKGSDVRSRTREAKDGQAEILRLQDEIARLEKVITGSKIESTVIGAKTRRSVCQRKITELRRGLKNEQ